MNLYNMINDNKHKILVWVIVALAALNISTLATIFWQQRQMPNGRSDRSGTNQMRPARGMAPMFIESVGFDDNQLADFQKLHQKFRGSGRATMERLAEYRELTLAELDSETPDTLVLNSLAEKIGSAHAELKRQGYRFYLETKKICRPEQYDELHRVFGQFMQTDSPSSRGKGLGEKGPHRQRNKRAANAPMGDGPAQ
jgi:Spy/CpxP family protein refolding chaperone